ncbi:MAG TPA: hypothetical protein DCL77_16785 [Prolixibacteraceae bacterium]|nr:hypothetical protein [Prolixibacteraceae bacterium]
MLIIVRTQIANWYNCSIVPLVLNLFHKKKWEYLTAIRRATFKLLAYKFSLTKGYEDISSNQPHLFLFN